MFKLLGVLSLTLLMICIFAFIIGMFKPQKIIRWGNKKRVNRKYLFLYFVCASLVLFTLLIIASTHDNPPIPPQKKFDNWIYSETSAKSNNVFGKGVQSIKILDSYQNLDKVIIEVYVNDTSSDRFVLYQHDAELFKYLYKTDLPIDAVRIITNIKFEDIYGKQSMDHALTIDINKETADKINWDHFNSNNLNKIADYYWSIPEFK